MIKEQSTDSRNDARSTITHTQTLGHVSQMLIKPQPQQLSAACSQTIKEQSSDSRNDDGMFSSLDYFIATNA